MPVAEPKHVYTIELRQAVYTDETFDIYNRYEKHVHKKERTSKEMHNHICCSPVYVPEYERDKFIMERESPVNFEKIDEGRVSKNEGINPGMGSYHFQHRIDGKLFAVGVTDFTNTMLNSQYLIYDPDYSFLSPGVLSAIHEIEYARMVRKKHNPNMLWYALGELVLDAPKVNYKLNYKPGYVICPRTHQIVPFDEVKDKMRHYSRLPWNYKKQHLTSTALVDLPHGYKTEFE